MMYATLDIETTGLDRYKSKVTWFGVKLYYENGRVEYSLRKDPDRDYIMRVYNRLKALKSRLIWQNGKFDTLFIEHHFGIRLPIHEDVMLMGTAYDLADEHGLKYMAKKYLGVPDWDIPNKEKLAGGDPVRPYLKADLDNTFSLFQFFDARLDDTQRKVYADLLLPAYKAYRDIERNGIYIDQKGLEAVRKDYSDKREKALNKLNTRWGKINWNSPVQVSKKLFEDQCLPIIEYTKTGNPSSDASVLKKLKARGFELAGDLLEYKFYYGATTKFLDQWGDYAAFDGRIHPSFKLTNVVTGRTSCSDPNLQQVPRNKELRSLFTAPKGRILLEADYSQIELRIAADYANEPTMIRIYQTGGDIHTETARGITGKDTPTKEDRTKAKPVNFGFLYGMGAKGFVNYALDNYGVVISLEEAETYRELFFAKYSRLLEWHKEMVTECELMGGASNRFGRFRKLPNIYSADWGEKNGAMRRSINSPVQGTASDLLLLAVVELNKALKPYGAFIVGTVHDSILIECDEDGCEEIISLVKKTMSHPIGLDHFKVTFKVPIEADVGAGPWGSK